MEPADPNDARGHIRLVEYDEANAVDEIASVVALLACASEHGHDLLAVCAPPMVSAAHT